MLKKGSTKMRKSGTNQERNRVSTSTKNWWKRLKQQWQNYQWWAISGGVVIVFVLAYPGFSVAKKNFSTLDILYRIIQLFVLNFDTAIIDPNWKLELARWLAPAVATYTAARLLAVIFSEQLKLLKIRFLKRHIIVCGLGNKGLFLSLKLKSDGHKVVAIELDEENDNIKECKDNGIIVLIGNGAAPYYLRKAGLNKAAYLLAVCGQDRINAEIAFEARRLVSSKKQKPLTCVIHITDTQLCRLIKEREFETVKNDVFRLEFINLFDLAARALIKSYPPMDEREEFQTSPPHLLIVGAGRMGESLVVHTAKKWLELPGRVGQKFKVSLIDKAAGKKQKIFYLRYPRLKEICQLMPLEMDLQSPEFEESDFLFDSQGECRFTVIYICLNNDSFALSTALSLHHQLRKFATPIVVRMSSETGLAELIQGEAHGLGRLHSFGLLDRVLEPELFLIGTHEILSRAIHEEYCRDQRARGAILKSNSSLVPWNELPETLKESNRRQAAYLGVKLETIGCYIVPMSDWGAETIEFSREEIEAMAKIEHDHWMEERINDGWKFDAGPKDNKKKTHPSLVLWEQLSEEEKEKDRNPVREMQAFLEKAGFQIYRRDRKAEGTL
jgi:hypothetical protein